MTVSTFQGDDAKQNDLEMEIALLREQLTRAERRVEELTALADRDPVVGVLNPRAFTRELARAIAGAARHGHAAALVLLDIEGLSAINERYGRAAGDLALAHLGRLVSAHVRTTDAVGRVRDDEFAVLLAFATEEAACQKIARLAERISASTLSLRNGTNIAVPVRYAVAAVCPKAGATEQLAELSTELHRGRDA